MAESLGITTASTTKTHGRNRDKSKGVGEILSSNGLLSDGTHIKLLIQLQLICEEIAGWLEYFSTNATNKCSILLDFL